MANSADTPEAQVLRRLGLTEAEASSLGFGDPEFVGEPYAWLLVMIRRSPQRSAFTDDLEAPGPWVVGFLNSLQLTYSSIATPAELSQVRRAFEGIAREYFAWHALGATEGDFRQLLRGVEPLVDLARSLIDRFDSARVSSVVGRAQGEEFGRAVAASRLRLSRRATTALNSVVRLRLPTVATIERKTAVATVEGTAAEPANTMPAPQPVQAATDQSPAPRNRSRPGRRERQENREARQSASPSPLGAAARRNKRRRTRS